MGNGCDPELSLRLGSGHYSSSGDSNSSRSSRVADWFGNTMQANQHQQPQQLQHHKHQQQQITIFYNGRICVCDVTEIQARAIICMAKREMEERWMENNNNHQLRSDDSSRPSSPLSLAPQLINPGLSVKRGLQRFLQKRKTRMDAASPYNCTAERERRPPSPSQDYYVWTWTQISFLM